MWTAIRLRRLSLRNRLNAFGFETEAGNSKNPERPDETLNVPFGNAEEIRRLLAGPAKGRDYGCFYNCQVTIHNVLRFVLQRFHIAGFGVNSGILHVEHQMSPPRALCSIRYEYYPLLALFFLDNIS